MWGGPTPHNLETLCLCYADQTRSEVPILSSNQDTVGKGRETTFSFPRSSLPRCRVVITQREVLIRLGILSDAKAVKPYGRRWGYHPDSGGFGARPLLAVVSVDWTPRGIRNWSMQIQQMQMPIRSSYVEAAVNSTNNTLNGKPLNWEQYSKIIFVYFCFCPHR